MPVATQGPTRHDVLPVSRFAFDAFTKRLIRKPEGLS